MQTDMQRTIVMMRPLDARDSAGTGFCRMERRGSRGKLVFTVQGIQREGPLHAVLLSQDGKEQQAQALGEIRVDGRGHGTMTLSLDNMTPSTAAGYRAVCIADAAGGAAELVMAGFFGKGRPFDRDGAERLTARTLGLSSGAEKPAAEKPAASPDARAAWEEKPIALNEPAQEEPAQDEAAPLPENIWAEPLPTPGLSPALGLPEELSDVIWPDSALPLRELFERFDVVSPVTGLEDEVFVSIPMNGGMMGIDHYLLGARLEDGEVVGIGYGIPGAADTPPPGLEGYAWMDTPIGGYWLKWETIL